MQLPMHHGAQVRGFYTTYKKQKRIKERDMTMIMMTDEHKSKLEKSSATSSMEKQPKTMEKKSKEKQSMMMNTRQESSKTMKSKGDNSNKESGADKKKKKMMMSSKEKKKKSGKDKAPKSKSQKSKSKKDNDDDDDDERDWVLMNVIESTHPGELLGWSLAADDQVDDEDNDGNRFVVGTLGNRVSVYRYNHVNDHLSSLGTVLDEDEEEEEEEQGDDASNANADKDDDEVASRVAIQNDWVVLASTYGFVGRVRVFSFPQASAAAAVPPPPESPLLVLDTMGQDYGSQWGSCVGLSSQNTLIVGATGDSLVAIYQFHNHEWSLRQQLEGNQKSDGFGYSCAIQESPQNDDEEQHAMIVVGAPYHNQGEGMVRFYERQDDDDDWVLSTRTLPWRGHEPTEWLGYAVDVSYPWVVASAVYARQRRGRVVLHNVVSFTTQTMVGTTPHSFFGQALSLYQNRYLAVGSFAHNDGLFRSGNVVVYQHDDDDDDDDWVPMGNPIVGQEPLDALGVSVTFLRESVLVIGSALHDGNNGQASVYQFQ